MRAKVAGVTVLACVLAGVSACADRDGDDDRGDRREVAGICTPFAAQGAAAAPTDPASVEAVTTPAVAGDAAAFDDCLHRWGYRLARSDDPAETAAAAVVAACAPTLARWNSTTLSQPAAAPDTAVSLVTGEPSTTLADRYRSAQSKALFYVVQARAGNCALPPAAATADTK
jgi:hypothetical protein